MEELIYFIHGKYKKAIASWEAAIQFDASVKRKIPPWIDKARARLGSRAS
jgi:hypothetical protein